METASVKRPVDIRQGDRRVVSYRVLTRSLLIAAIAGAALYAGYYFANTADSGPPPASSTSAPK